MKNAAFRLFLLVLLLGTWHTPALAEAGDQPPVSVQVTAGLDGYCRAGYWTPIRLLVENHGASLPSVTARVENTIEELQFDLPANARKRFEMYIQPQEGYRNTSALRLQYTQALSTTHTLHLRCLSGNDLLIGLWSNENLLGSLISPPDDQDVSVKHAYLSADTLPEQPQAYQILHLLVIGPESDTRSLSARQKEALRTWVLNGGDLLVTGGGNWSNALGLSDMLPFTPQGSRRTTQIRLPNGTSVTGDFTLAEGVAAPQSRLLAGTPQAPLALVRSYGLGRVLYTTFNPLEIPPTARQEVSRYLWAWAAPWETLPQLIRYANGENAVASYLPSDLYKLLHLQPKSKLAASVVWLIVTYTIAAGPLQMFLLRRKRERLWLSTILLVLLFSLLFGVLGNLLRPPSHVKEYYVIQAWPESEHALLTGFAGFYNARGHNPSLEVDSPWLITGLQPSYQDEQPQFRVQHTPQGLQIPQIAMGPNAMAHFLVSGLVPAPRYQAESHLSIEGEWLIFSGSIQWEEPFSLTNVQLVSRAIITHKLQDIHPGQNTLSSTSLLDSHKLRTHARALGDSQPLPDSHSALPLRPPEFAPYNILSFADFPDVDGATLRKVWKGLSSAYPPLPDDRVLVLGWAEASEVAAALPAWQEREQPLPREGKVLFMLTLPVAYTPENVLPPALTTTWTNARMDAGDSRLYLCNLLPAIPPDTPLRLTLAGKLTPPPVPPPNVEVWNYRSAAFEPAPAEWPLTWENGRDYLSPENFCLFRLALPPSASDLNIQDLSITFQPESQP